MDDLATAGPDAVEAALATGDLDAEPLPPDRFLDRELSLARVQPAGPRARRGHRAIPLLERAKFLAIFASNLDEFFMVRVAGLKRRIATGIAVRAASGGLPREVHDAILARTRELMAGTRAASATTCGRRWPRRASRSCAGTS